MSIDQKQHNAASNLMRGTRHLRAEDICFSDEVCRDENQLNFYMNSNFDVDAVFGTSVCTDENDDYINIYADYDLEKRCVCDTLCVVHIGEKLDREFTYTLSPEEKALFLSKMDDYCLQDTDQTLDEWSEQYMRESQEMSEQTM